MTISIMKLVNNIIRRTKTIAPTTPRPAKMVDMNISYPEIMLPKRRPTTMFTPTFADLNGITPLNYPQIHIKIALILTNIVEKMNL